MFYLNCGSGASLVGASPECLCKVDKSLVTNHAIAGTIMRGKTPAGELMLLLCVYFMLNVFRQSAEDAANARILSESAKDRAEHVMLVDLARNDVNRVCKPETVKVDSLMRVEKFSHVMHLTSQISGMLREGKTRSMVARGMLSTIQLISLYSMTDSTLSDLFSLLVRFPVHPRSGLWN